MAGRPLQRATRLLLRMLLAAAFVLALVVPPCGAQLKGGSGTGITNTIVQEGEAEIEIQVCGRIRAVLNDRRPPTPRLNQSMKGSIASSLRMERSGSIRRSTKPHARPPSNRTSARLDD